jgi:hypothetical protein
MKLPHQTSVCTLRTVRGRGGLQGRNSSCRTSSHRSREGGMAGLAWGRRSHTPPTSWCCRWCSWSCPSTPSMSVWQSMFSLAASTLPTSGTYVQLVVAALAQGRHQHSVSSPWLTALFHTTPPHW